MRTPAETALNVAAASFNKDVKNALIIVVALDHTDQAYYSAMGTNEPLLELAKQKTEEMVDQIGTPAPIVIMGGAPAEA